jgi:hypothetical protein
MTNASIIKQIEDLRNKRFDLILKLREVKEKESESFNSLGWGYGMRSYSRLSKMNFTKSKKIEDKIENIENKIETLCNVLEIKCA